MACLAKSRRTKYWVLKYRDLDTGEWRGKSTKCLVSDPKETRTAQRMAEAQTKREAQVAPQSGETFSAWVGEFIESHFSQCGKSRKRYTFAWARVAEWARLRNVKHPAEVRYAHAADYMEWRKASGASHNSARLELKFFSSVLQEAMRRDLCDKNPLALARVPKEAAQEKKELTSEDFAKARAAFAARKSAPWMLTVFEICAHLGCRFNEAELGRGDVDFDAGEITLTDSKRSPDDPRKKFKVPLPPALATHLRAVFEKRDRTAPAISGSGEHNRQLNRTLRTACGATSHSLRVSFITRCHRAGLSEAQAMRLVNHTTRMVHAIYSKLSNEDARAAALRVLPPI